MSTPLEDVIHSYGSEILCSQEVIEKYRQKANIELASLRENAFASAQLRTELAAKDAKIAEMLHALERAEQTIRNLGNGWLTGDGQTIALNESSNIRAVISHVKGEQQ